MSGVPVETVVDLLMANRSWDRDAGHVIYEKQGNFLTYSRSIDELRAKVRDYVETLRKDGV